MKLVSKIHDYYDGVIRNTTHDTTHTFIRKSHQLNPISRNIHRPIDVKDSNCSYFIEFEIVGFCGQLFPCINVYKSYYGIYAPDSERFYVYDWEECKKLIPLKNTEKNNLLFSSVSHRIESWLKNSSCFSWDKKLKYNIQDDSYLKNLFIEQNVAYFHMYLERSEYRIEAYPTLKDLSFFKKYDAYSCFQKIEQFLTNDLVKKDMIDIKISDVLKAKSHGFDKWSFRKESNKK